MKSKGKISLPGQFNLFNTIPNEINLNDKILILDTETTGVPLKYFHSFFDYRELKAYDRARLIQLSYGIFKAKDLSYCYHKNFFVKNIDITNYAQEINHIDDNYRNSVGIYINEVLDNFTKDLSKVKAIVCHGCDFDINVLLSESHRVSKESEIGKITEDAIRSKIHICTKHGDRFPIRTKHKYIPAQNPSRLPLSERVEVNFDIYPFLRDLKPHDSLFDVFLTLELLRKKISLYE